MSSPKKKWENKHANDPLNRLGRRILIARDRKKASIRIKKDKSDKSFERSKNIQIKQESIIAKATAYREEKAAEPKVRAKMKVKRLKAVAKIQARSDRLREKRLKNLAKK